MLMGLMPSAFAYALWASATFIFRNGSRSIDLYNGTASDGVSAFGGSPPVKASRSLLGSRSF